MKLNRSPVVSLSSSVLDAVMDGYVAWREESIGVGAAYRRWLQAGRQERVVAFAAYGAALDREERAAGEYQRLIETAQGDPSINAAVRAIG
jgi:hypothetical protein